MKPTYRTAAAALHEAWAVFRRDPADARRRVLRWLRPMPPPYRRRWRMTLRQWLLHHQRSVLFENCNWMGVRTLKNPLDAWIYQELLFEVRPDIVLEIGSYAGGSTLYFAHLQDLLGHGRVLSVDIDRTHFAVSHPRIVEVTGDSQSDELKSRIREICAGQRVLAIHDGDHRRGAVLADLESYCDLVPPGSYFVVEDGIMDLFRPGDGLGTYEPGPLAASQEFVARHPEFEVDTRRERYLMTYNPAGFLRRRS